MLNGWPAGPARVRMAVVAVLVAVGAGCAPTREGADAEVRYQAAIPDPIIVAQGVSSANAEHVFHDPARDFALMRSVFNAVSLLPGDPSIVTAARRAGLAVVLEFDYKKEFFAGEDISAKVAAVVEQVRSRPGSVAAIHVADRLNEKFDAAQGLRYLAATGGVFKREIPGVPVLLNAPDWELTCGHPGQRTCRNNDARFAHETNATLDRFYRSGHVDGLSISNNLKNLDARVQRIAWTKARRLWPEPFILWSTSSQLSFGDESYAGTPDAPRAVEAYMRAPVEGGAQGLAIWAWHQLYDGRVHTFLNKDGSTNALWEHMTAASDALRRNNRT